MPKQDEPVIPAGQPVPPKDGLAPGQPADPVVGQFEFKQGARPLVSTQVGWQEEDVTRSEDRREVAKVVVPQDRDARGNDKGLRPPVPMDKIVGSELHPTDAATGLPISPEEYDRRHHPLTDADVAAGKTHHDTWREDQDGPEDDVRQQAVRTRHDPERNARLKEEALKSKGK